MQGTRVQRIGCALLGAAFLLGILGGCGGPAAAPKPKSKTHSSAGQTGSHSQKKTSQHGAKSGGKGKKGKPSGKKHRAMPPTAVSLATLPPLRALRSFNPALRYYHRLSHFIPGMGIHVGPPGPGITLMVNTDRQVTAVETNFPQRLGTYPWFDPPTTAPNSGVAFHSEHLYFVPPSSITPGMSPSLPTDLASWAKFVSVNTRLTDYVRLPMKYKGLLIYGPPNGPGLMVLVRPGSAATSPSGTSGTSSSSAGGGTSATGSAGGGTSPGASAATGPVVGFIAEEPAKWGWFPWYAQPKGKPVPSKLFGQAYYSVLLLQPVP